MNCDESREMLDPYVDHQLSLGDRRAVENHLQSCASCTAAQARIERLIDVIQAGGHYTAPPVLRSRIQSTLRVAAEEEKKTRPWWRSWALGTAPLMSALAAAWIVLTFFAGPSTEELAIQEIISAHVRSLMLDNLTHVASSDRHAVKPWFSDKLDFSPWVKDLSGEGFQLLGGRLDYVQHRPVAAIVYRHRKHVINLFIWPSQSTLSTRPRITARQGYHLIHWRDAGLVYWVVSDLNRAELQDLVDLIKHGTVPMSASQ